jgi:hypothetical protein
VSSKNVRHEDKDSENIYKMVCELKLMYGVWRDGKKFIGLSGNFIRSFLINLFVIDCLPKSLLTIIVDYIDKVPVL